MWGQGRPQALQPGTTRSKVQFYLLAGTPNFSASPLARQLKGDDSGRPKKGGLALVNEAINVHGAEQSARTDTKQDFFFFFKVESSTPPSNCNVYNFTDFKAPKAVATK